MKKISLIVVVVFAFALLLGVGVKGAQASSLLFPYLSTQSGVYSFVTIANYGDSAWGQTGITNYHLSYAHKTAGATNFNTIGCNHLDANVTTTPNDMMTFEVGGKVTDAGNVVLFENAAPVTSTALTLPISNQIAFLIVEPVPVGPQTAAMANVYGWADVIDTAANMTLNYSTTYLNNVTDSDPDFSNLDAATGWRVASWYPTTYVTTSWHILPVGLRSAMAPSAGGGIRRGLYATANDANTYAAWDRDEHGWSGSYNTGVYCFGIISRADVLMPGVVANTDAGGFMFLEDTAVTISGTSYSSGPFIVHKIQSATAAAGVGTRTGINREPMVWPAFTP